MRGVLISGAGSGIGQATAVRFGELGDYVGCIDLNAEWASRTADSIRSAGGKAIGLCCDVSEPAQVKVAIERFVGVVGSLEVVVSNAGILVRKDLATTTVEDWDRTMAVNVRGAFLLMKFAVPDIARSGGGAVIGVTSVVAHIGFGLPAYTASKGALVSLLRELSGELAHLKIRVNGVSPGTVVGTAITEESLRDPDLMERTTAAVPLGRLCRPSDVAAAVIYLASQEAAMITGHILAIDGGVSSSVYSMQRRR